MATNTYEAIATETVVGSSTNSVSFTGISGAYTDIVFVCEIDGSDGGASTRIRFNSDTASNYSQLDMRGNGSSASISRVANTAQISLGAGTATNKTTVTGYINGYSNSTTYKTTVLRFNNPDEFVGARAGTWRNTNAITGIEFSVSAGVWVAGSTFSLYGIRAEGVSPAPKATGGAIYSDEDYYYHILGASGTFTPTQSITADVLVVAGGGGGGTANRGGGGGAGGIIYFAGQSLTATGYACTIGAGGTGFTQGVNSQFASLTVASGGGRGGASNFGGAYLATAGGSGGGNGNDGTNNGGASNQSSSGATAIYGNRGGNVTVGGDVAGGGGAGAAGTDGVNSNNGIAGGAGTNAFSSWKIGEFREGSYYLAAGGNGGASFSGGGSLLATRAFGGGGANSSSSYDASGIPNTGSGGSGFSYNGGANTYPAGSGGSGLIAIRYLKA